MKSNWRFLLTLTFLVGVFVTALIGTSTATTFVWPGYLLIGLGGIGAAAYLLRDAGFAMPRWTSVAGFALFGYLVLRAVESPVIYFAREDAALVVACFLVYAGILVHCASGTGRRAVWFLVAALVGANLLFAALQLCFDRGLWLLPGYERSAIERVGGLFNQPDHYAAFLAMTVPLWLSLAVFSRGAVRPRKGWAILALLTATGVLFTGSAAGAIALLSGLFAFAFLASLLLWKRFKPTVRKRLALIATGLVLSGTAICIVLSGPIARHLSRDLLTRQGDASIAAMWEAGARQAMESPVLGTGSRSSYVYTRLHRPDDLAATVGETEFVHNEPLQMLADYGIVGFLLAALVLILHVRGGFAFLSGYRGYRPAPGELVPRSDHLAAVVGALGMLPAALTASLFDYVLHLPSFAIVLSAMLAVLAAPDPMASALNRRSWSSLLPGGMLHFATRTTAVGAGVAMLALGFIYARSEFHYEKARIAFESGQHDFQLMRHLKAARSLDPVNPYAFSLSAHAQVAAITPELSAPARRQALEQADQYFAHARRLYPQDVFAAVGHAAVLDELGRSDEALQRITEAREWAPLYGNLMLAEAEHHLRHGEIAEAEIDFRGTLAASAYGDVPAAEQGLRTISEWKFMAMQEGIRWDPEIDLPGGDRRLREAKVEERAFAGEAIPEPDDWEEPTKGSPETEASTPSAPRRE